MNPLQSIMNPASVVVVGASNNFMKMGSIQALNLLSGGYEGEVVFIHPKETTVLGKPAYKTPADLPFVPDLALLVTPTKITPGLLDGLGERGVRHAVIVTAGFREVGGEGPELERKLIEAADRHGIRFVGPNCIGIINTHIGLNLTVCPYTQKPGGLGLISQSGTYVAQTLPYLRDKGIRYSKAISIGNATNLDLVDCLDYLADDPETKAIAVYTEGIGRGREFIQAASRAAAKKPVVALYVGGTETGARSCLSHTGSMGGPNSLYDGIFRQAGVIRAGSLRELFNWGHALATMPAPSGKRMAILTHSGGPASSMADACEREGLELPVFSDDLQKKIREYIEPTASAKNPVDLTFTMDHDVFIKLLPEVLFGSDEVDAVLIHGLMDTGFANEMYPTISKLASISREDFLSTMHFDLTRLLELPGEFGKPLVCSTFLREDHAAGALRDGSVPLYSSPEQAVGAMAALVRYKILQEEKLKEAPFAVKLPEAAKSVKQSSGAMNEYESAMLLSSVGIPVARQELVTDLAQAKAAVEKIGYPVVLKGLPENVAHKTEAGLVHLGIDTEQRLTAAWDAIEKSAPGCPRVVAEMIKGDRELMVGITRFPGFGPCVALGIGGVFTEAFHDITFRAAPVSREQAFSMMDSLRLGKLLNAQRGLPEVDRENLANTLQAIGDLALAHPEINEIDINPLIITDGKPVAADALIVTETPQEE